jgi:hypothetical protein
MHPCTSREWGFRMRYKSIKGLEETEVPNKEELIYLLQSHDLYHRKDMNREELWNIFTTYFNVRDELITILEDPNKNDRKQLLFEYMERFKN